MPPGQPKLELQMRSTTPTILRVAIEQHFLEVDGKVYTDIAFDYTYWQEYLQAFDEIVVIGRVGHAQRIRKGCLEASGPNVRFHGIHDYLGFWQFLRYAPRVLRQCGRAVKGDGPILLRMGNISLMCWLHLVLARRPYALEVVGHAGMSAKTVKAVQFLKLGHLIALVLHALCRLTASSAACASYVSEYVRRLYPTRSGCEWVFSGVKLPERAFKSPRPPERFRLPTKRVV